MAVNQKDTEIECCEEHVVHMDAVDLARSEMPGDEITSAASDFFKAFSDKTRLRILTALVTGELCVCDIAALLGMRFLKQARLVRSRKNGKTVYYALCDDHIQIILAQGIAHVQEG